MKVNFTSLFFALMFFCTVQLTAQSENDSGLWPNGLTAKVLFIDYGNLNDRDDLNISNGLEVAYVRNLAPFLNIALPVKIGVGNIVSNDNKTTFYGIDGHFQFQYYKKGNKLIPYALAGLGYVNEVDGVSNAQIPLGFGLNYKVNEGGYVTLQFEYRKSLEEARDNLQLGLGWHFRLGKGDLSKVDTDGDGISNADDNCPNIPGVASAYGCPDADGDGVADKADECPTEVGLTTLQGCPDTDEDGIANHKDECPEEVGTEENKGCPVADTDEDGVPDDEDDCPTEKGTVNGCPDADNDGVADSKDECPEIAGILKGCPDADNDGLNDSEDECPNEAGKLKGCPDTDGDGVADKDDKCPEDFGDAKRKGCPQQDTDGDGVNDDKDECPKIAGKPLLKGCPDSDGDGMSDIEDKCPNEAGSRDSDGCPDSDGDGLSNDIDECPNERGPSKNNGCPEITEEDQETLDLAMSAVRFESGSSNFKAESFAVLEKVVQILNRYPDYNLKINGHTDNVGLDANNLRLSQERATACMEYLKARGVAATRLSATGYGETQPISTNETAEGRKLNRRVEFELIFK